MKGADKDPQALFASIDEVSVHSYEYASQATMRIAISIPFASRWPPPRDGRGFLDVKEKGESTQIYV